MVQWLPFKFVKQLYLAFVFQIIHVTSPYTQLGTSCHFLCPAHLPTFCFLIFSFFQWFTFILFLVIKFFLSHTWLNTYFALKLTVTIEETMVYFSNQVTKLLNLKASTSVASYYFHWTIRPSILTIPVYINIVFPMVSICQSLTVSPVVSICQV